MDDDNDRYERGHRTNNDDDDSIDEGGNEIMQRKQRGNLKKRNRTPNPE